MLVPTTLAMEKLIKIHLKDGSVLVLITVQMVDTIVKTMPPTLTEKHEVLRASNLHVIFVQLFA